MSSALHLEHVVLAAAIGLLVGIERGWQLREKEDGKRVAGIRTFTLIGLLGGICGLLAQAAGPLVLGLGLLGFSLSFGLFELQHMRATRQFSATDLVAGLVTFALGAYAVTGDMAMAAAGGVIAVVMLAERSMLHGFLRRLTWIELRAALLLLVMTAVLLPALPDRAVDPWGALNPHQIWLMTVLIAAISFAGYVAMRLAGERRGLLYAGAMGGLVTSTTVTWTFARLVRRQPGATMEVTAAILAAWIVSLIRMAAVALIIAPRSAAVLLPPLAGPALALALPATAFYVAAARIKNGVLALQNPFELGAVLKFGALLAAVMLASRLAGAAFGGAGLSLLSALSGILDVDPITLSMAQAMKGGMVVQEGVAVILIAAFTNGLAKTVLGFAFGGLRLGALLAGAMLLGTATGALLFFR